MPQSNLPESVPACSGRTSLFTACLTKRLKMSWAVLLHFKLKVSSEYVPMIHKEKAKKTRNTTCNVRRSDNAFQCSVGHVTVHRSYKPYLRWVQIRSAALATDFLSQKRFLQCPDGGLDWSGQWANMANSTTSSSLKPDVNRTLPTSNTTNSAAIQELPPDSIQCHDLWLTFLLLWSPTA